MQVYHRIDVNFALRHATCLNLTSSNDQRHVRDMITSLRSKCMTSCYHHSLLKTSSWERANPICGFWVIAANSVPNINPQYQPSTIISK